MNSTKLLTKPMFKKLQILVNYNSHWNNYLNLFESWDKFPHGIHLAIFVEPYLTYILEGKKTIESRFSINRSPPYKKIKSGDIVLLKLSGGPIVGICQMTNIWSYRLDLKSWKMIRKKFTNSLYVQDSNFWNDRKYASYATLMKIKNPISFKPFKIEKKDRRAWVVLRSKNSQQHTLDVT